ncbi:arabinose operon transcriptional regulator AraC [Oryzibacter oryziterrae]|uniref:arabinose operon transcriptional regulator AraC n=1 Tax=Oryzibacter oryziterrae TaxID=2766474 RepID=UPI001F006D69|nr:arabinose operon transcriptional regulator AraC [Oryzibacter oryziterrae]
MDDTAIQTSTPAQVESVIRRLSLLQHGDVAPSPDPDVAPLFPGFRFDTNLVAGITPIERNGPLDFRITRPDGMRGWIINLTIKGAGEVFDGTNRFVVRPGDLVLLPPGAVHDYGLAPGAEDWWHRWIYFQPRAYWGVWLNWQQQRGDSFFMRCDDDTLFADLERSFDEVTAWSVNRDLLSMELAMNILERVILLCAKKDRATAPPGHFDPRLLMACKFVTDNLHRPLTVAEIAQEVCLSPSRLAHLFTQTLGRSILRWREEQVIQFACHLLLVSPSPVKQIAAQVGFEDPLYFSRVFRRYIGCSPKAFRAEHGRAME